MKKKAGDYKYPNIIIEMARQGDTFEGLSQILDITRPTLIAKLFGRSEWSIGEIETLCKHYNKDYYELFRGE